MAFSFLILGIGVIIAGIGVYMLRNPEQVLYTMELLRFFVDLEELKEHKPNQFKRLLWVGYGVGLISIILGVLIAGLGAGLYQVPGL